MITTLLNNRYQIIQLLGAGGFGETFLAEDTYMPSHRRCVIKKLKPVVNDPSMYQLIQQRFQREAATLEALSEGSSQIPKLYAYFSENDQFFLVQEWIPGQTLATQVATTGTLSENAVREILVSLLQVLDYIHSQGIIYHDIKPNNIILRESNNQPVLIDFGAVKETMATALNSQGKLMHTMVVGTPGFMSPEQAAGRPVFASDIYSLGLTAIFLLTGKLPQDLEISPQEEILWQHLVPEINLKLAAILSKAIQYHPRDRYTTANKMLEDLQHSNDAVTMQTALLSNNPRRQKTKHQQKSFTVKYSRRKNYRLVLAITSLLLGILAAIALFYYFRQQPPAADKSDGNTLPEAELATTPPPIKSPSPTPSAIASPILPPIESPAPPPPLFPPLEKLPPLNQASEPPLVQSPQPQKKPENPPEKSPPASLPPTTPPPENTPPQVNSELPIAPSPTPESPSPTPHTVVSPLSPPVDPVPPHTQVLPPPRVPASPHQNQEAEIPPIEQSPSVALPTAPTPENIPSAQVEIPAFPTGTSEKQVKAILGNPIKTMSGIWGNTRAAIYEIQPSQVTLGYLFDRDSGRLRQTEVSFAQSIEPQVMQETLQQLLNGNVSAEISEGLQQVYQRQSNQYSFSTEELKGVIERDDRDRIYIGVWEADLH